MTEAQGTALVRGLESFDRRSLREGAAALALWPANADRHVAVRALIDALASAPEEGGGREIGAAEWGEWLAGDEAKTLQGIVPDGLYDAPLASAAALLGARRSLLAGALEFPALHYRLWIEAIAGGSDEHLEAAKALLTATSWLTDRIVEHGRMEFHPWPADERHGPVVAPPERKLERLRAALRVEFDDLEVARIFAAMQRDPEGSPWRPLSREAETMLLVADPWLLSLAGLVQSIDLAARSPQLPAVLAAVRRGSLAVALEAVKEMGWTVEAVEADHVVARADVDCLVVVGVGVVSPDPAQLAAEELDGGSQLVEGCERLAARARSLGASHALLAYIGDGRAVFCDDPIVRVSDTSNPWILGLGELQTIGEGLRGDPLALPAALGSAPRPPWPENFDLLDWVGAIRHGEESGAADRLVDGTEEMRVRAKIMASRHPAIDPDFSAYVEVTRWEGIEEPAILCSRDWDEFALLVRAPARYLWVTCPGSLERRYELLPVIATALAFWMARLTEVGFQAPPRGIEGPICARFRLEIDRRPGPQLAIVSDGPYARVVLGPGFVEALCRGDNEADRTLVGALVSWEGRMDVESVLEEVVPPGRGTVAVWARPEDTSNPPRLDPPPPVEPRARREIERGLAASGVQAGEIVVASDEQLEPALDGLVRGLEAGIRRSLDSLEPDALRALVALHERVSHQSHLEAIMLPARSAIPVAATHPKLGKDILLRDLVMRILVESASAAPPCGAEPFGRRAGALLRAATELQLELRGALDAVRWEQAGGRVVISPEMGIRVELGGMLPDASDAMKDQMIAAAPDLMAEQHSDWWDEEAELRPSSRLDRPIPLEGDWARVDEAMSEEWGVGLGQMLRLLYALAAIADEEVDCVRRASPDLVEAELVKRTEIPAAVVAGALGRLTLSACPDYDPSREEDQPGRANRERSYLRRPLVALADGDLCWSRLHCERVAKYLGALIESGRMRASGSLRSAVIGLSQGLDSRFEDAVLAAVRRGGWEGAVRVTELDGTPLRRRRGEEIGDIDVLAWSLDRRQVWLLDAKRLNPGVEPGPMLREGQAMQKSIERHEERLRWVREHPAELARQIGVDSIEGWRVDAALVLDRPLAGAHLGKVAMPIWTLWSLPGELSGEAER